MSLSLQPSVTVLPLDGLPMQSHDGTAPQSPSFGEVLMVEEKKLLQEQEANTLSVAAMHATIQMPIVTEPITRFEASAESPSTESAAQPALVTDSVRTANPSPQQNLPTEPTVKVSQPANTAPVFKSTPPADIKAD